MDRFRVITSFVWTAVAMMICSIVVQAQDKAEPANPKSAVAIKAKVKYHEELRRLEEDTAKRERELRDVYSRALDEARKEALRIDDLDEAQRIVNAKQALLRPAPPQRPADEPPKTPVTSVDPLAKKQTGLVIRYAFFGVGNTWADVTQAVRKQVRSSTLSIVHPLDGNDLPRMGFPDPAPNKRKILLVIYSNDGRMGIVEAAPNESIELPLNRTKSPSK